MTNKAIDETWKYLEHPNQGVEDEPYVYFPDGSATSPDWDSRKTAKEVGFDRGKLMAAAPDMARLLNVFEMKQDHSGSVCATCGKRWDRIDGILHHEDCEWLRVMRKAGLR